MTDTDKINLVSKIGGEYLAQSRQWEQIGFALLAALLTVLGVVVANKALLQGLSMPWSVASWGSIILLLGSLALVSARYLLLSALYFSMGFTRLNAANAAARGDASHTVESILTDRFGSAGDLNMSSAAYHLAHLLSGTPLFLVALAALIIAAGQAFKTVS